MNESLRRAKAFDFYGQCAMILLPLIGAVVTRAAPWYILFTLGTWQLCSYFIHLSLGTRPWKRPARRAYGLALLILAIAGPFAALTSSGIIIYLLCAAAAGIILGSWYLAISHSELRKIETA